LIGRLKKVQKELENLTQVFILEEEEEEEEKEEEVSLDEEVISSSIQSTNLNDDIKLEEKNIKLKGDIGDEFEFEFGFDEKDKDVNQVLSDIEEVEENDFEIQKKEVILFDLRQH